jgi:transaldolase
MSAEKINTGLERKLQDFITKGFSPRFNQLKDGFVTKPKWQKLREVGTKLWLDSGNIEDIEEEWTREFSGLTVNNTLLNKEIQAGRYDSLIPEIVNLLNNHSEINEQQRMLEINFVLNAYHGLRLVEKFDAYVSLEEHTDLAFDVDQAVDYAKRLYAICPERFCIKIPFTAAGLLATRKLSTASVPVNHTLGFSARQNYLISRIAKPAYVNVFLGRLNSFVSDNDLGSCDYIGEKATLASQKAVKDLRAKNLTKSRQIGASFRNGQQIHSLAGIDVMTIPPKVAGQFQKMDIGLDVIVDRKDWEYTEGVKKEVDPESIGLNSLLDIDENLVSCIDKLEGENLDNFTTDDLYKFFKEQNCADVLVRWDKSQIETSFKEGKIPNLRNWADALKSKQIGLDSLMNLAGLNSFKADQQEMDQRVKSILIENSTE